MIQLEKGEKRNIIVFTLHSSAADVNNPIHDVYRIKNDNKTLCTNLNQSYVVHP